MAAPGLLGGRIAQHEERTSSGESSVTPRTPVPTVSPVSPEQPVSPVQVAEPSGKNLWEQICEGRQLGRAWGAGRGRPGGGRV